MVYNILGQELARLVDGYAPAGSYKIQWSPDNLSSGIYFCRIIAGSFIETKMIVLLK